MTNEESVLQIKHFKTQWKLQEQTSKKLSRLLKDREAEVKALKSERTAKFIHFGMVIGYGLLGCTVGIISIYIGKII